MSQFTLAEQTILLQLHLRRQEYSNEAKLLSYYTPQTLSKKYLNQLFKYVVPNLKHFSEYYYVPYGKTTFFCITCGYETQRRDRRCHHKHCIAYPYFDIAAKVWPHYFQISDLNEAVLIKIPEQLDYLKIFKISTKNPEFITNDHTKRLRDQINGKQYY